MIRFGTVAVGDGAPLGCARCTLPLSPSYHSAEDVTRALAAMAASWRDVPGPNVVLGGPEPFAHPQLPSLVAAAVDAGFQRIALETDGAALSVVENAEGLVGAGVRHVRVRVVTTDGGQAGSLVPRPSAVEAARRGVAAYRAAAERAGIRTVVTAIVPVCAHNAHMLPSTVADLAAWGVDAVRLEGAGVLAPDSSGVMAAACDTGMVNRLWVETDGTVPLSPSHALHEAQEGGSDD